MLLVLVSFISSLLCRYLSLFPLLLFLSFFPLLLFRICLFFLLFLLLGFIALFLSSILRSIHQMTRTCVVPMINTLSFTPRHGIEYIDHSGF